MKIVSAFVFASLMSGAAFAAEPPPGASSCSSCHAGTTAAETPVPKINGRKADEIMTALAALVPCALDGIRQTSLCASPRLRW